jgi:hypothetical protein
MPLSGAKGGRKGLIGFARQIKNRAIARPVFSFHNRLGILLIYFMSPRLRPVQPGQGFVESHPDFAATGTAGTGTLSSSGNP